MEHSNLPEGVRKAFAALCLLSLSEVLIEPGDDDKHFEANRIIFTESPEFQKIADLLSIEVCQLRSYLLAYLKAAKDNKAIRDEFLELIEGSWFNEGKLHK